MSAFITNFQSPVEMQDLEDRFRRGGISNLNMLCIGGSFSLLNGQWINRLWWEIPSCSCAQKPLLTILDVFTPKSEKPGRKTAL